MTAHWATRGLAIIALATAAACGRGAQSVGKRYALQGTVIAINRDRREITVQHGDIPGFMSAMTMSYPVADASTFDGLENGDEIRADLVVSDGEARLEHVVVVKRPAPRGPLNYLPAAKVELDSANHEIVIELPPIPLPAAGRGVEMPMVLEPVFSADLPVSGAFYGARVELVDGAGRALPHTLLHHFNLSDPNRRELFLPIGLHLMAASKETPAISVPHLLFGLPFTRDEQLLTSAMLGNSSPVAYPDVRVRLRLRYEMPSVIWPLYSVYPWVLDVMFPLGHGPDGSKAFDLPPGRSEHAFEASPAVPGSIIGLGGHIHDYGVSLELTDVTTGEVLWHGTPIRDAAGHVLSMPVSTFYKWNRLGLHVVPRHRYRVSVVYDNPTGHLIRNGGMGAIGGLLVPDRGVRWPIVDSGDSLYQKDLRATLRIEGGGDMDMSGMGPVVGK